MYCPQVAGTTEKDESVRINVAPNPSHLEVVYPVVQGMVYAQQQVQGNREKVLGLHVHGDGAFAGLGIVAETLQISQVEGYNTGGSIHIIINNQIGFTTTPAHARSSIHPTGITLVRTYFTFIVLFITVILISNCPLHQISPRVLALPSSTVTPMTRNQFMKRPCWQHTGVRNLTLILLWTWLDIVAMVTTSWRTHALRYR
jgi:hypothetical protein